jgi:hypothetical protein
MARNEARRQQKLMKKRQKDKVRRKARAEMVPYSMLDARKKIRLARQCPPYECLINASWKDKGLATILISRRQPDGNLLFGVYLVDILCLGVKNTFCNADFSLSRYSTDVVGRTYRNEEPGRSPKSWPTRSSTARFAMPGSSASTRTRISTCRSTSWMRPTASDPARTSNSAATASPCSSPAPTMMCPAS